MIRLPKAFVSLVAVALIACGLTLAVPRAAHAVAAAMVLVTNTAANPVPNQDVDAPARHAIAEGCSGQSSCQFSPVPAGQELVIQTLTIQFLLGSSTSLTQILDLRTVTGGANLLIAAFPVPIGSNLLGPSGSATHSLTAYADPGTAPMCELDTTVNSFITCAITGYTVSLP